MKKISQWHLQVCGHKFCRDESVRSTGILASLILSGSGLYEIAKETKTAGVIETEDQRREFACIARL